MKDSDLVINYHDFWNLMSPDRYNVASFQIPEILKREFHINVTFNDDTSINDSYFEFETKKDKLIFLLKCN
jgi:hypothetical protein